MSLSHAYALSMDFAIWRNRIVGELDIINFKSERKYFIRFEIIGLKINSQKTENIIMHN